MSALLVVRLLAGLAHDVEASTLLAARVQTGQHDRFSVVVVTEETELREQLRVELFRGRHRATETY